MHIVIDYETDPDFSFCDEPDRDYVSLCTMLYDGDEYITGLFNSTFYEDSDDWTTGTFDSVEDIPARCPYLREVAAELVSEYTSSKKG